MSDAQPLLPVAIVHRAHTQPASLLTRVEGTRQVANGPGILFNKAFFAGGKYVEVAISAVAQACGLGPVAATERAVSILGNATGRVSMLDELHSFRHNSANSAASNKAIKAIWKLRKECRKVLKYACGYVIFHPATYRSIQF